MNIGILALGTYAPQRVMTNKDFETYLDTSDEWISSRTGIRERRFAAEDEFTSHLAFRSVEDLIRRYGREALDGVDLVIVATNTPDALFPATAALVQDKFDLKAGAYDLLAGCPGWGYALAQAYAMVQSGLSKKVLAIGSEVLSKLMDMNDRSTAVLFGDGAGAAVIGPVPEGYGFKSFVLGADGSGAKELMMSCIAPNLPDGFPMTKHVYMNGREVFKFAVRVMNTATLEAIEKAGLTQEQIKYLIPHQANARIIEAARERLGLPPEQVWVNVNRYGNTSTASMPIALQEAMDAGQIHDGDHILFITFGAGLTWAASVLTWWGGANYQPSPLPEVEGTEG